LPSSLYLTAFDIVGVHQEGAAVYVEVRGEQADVRDPDNCRALDVRVSAGDRLGVDAALRAAGLGRRDGGAEAHLSIAALHAAAAGGLVASDWPDRWHAMIRYAEMNGWVSPDGTHLRAHLVDID
jgi:hypothetical protein